MAIALVNPKTGSPTTPGSLAIPVYQSIPSNRTNKNLGVLNLNHLARPTPSSGNSEATQPNKTAPISIGHPASTPVTAMAPAVTSKIAQRRSSSTGSAQPLPQVVRRPPNLVRLSGFSDNWFATTLKAVKKQAGGR